MVVLKPVVQTASYLLCSCVWVAKPISAPLSSAVTASAEKILCLFTPTHTTYIHHTHTHTDRHIHTCTCCTHTQRDTCTDTHTDTHTHTLHTHIHTHKYTLHTHIHTHTEEMQSRGTGHLHKLLRPALCAERSIVHGSSLSLSLQVVVILGILPLTFFVLSSGRGVGGSQEQATPTNPLRSRLTRPSVRKRPKTATFPTHPQPSPRTIWTRMTTSCSQVSANAFCWCELCELIKKSQNVLHHHGG